MNNDDIKKKYLISWKSTLLNTNIESLIYSK